MRRALQSGPDGADKHEIDAVRLVTLKIFHPGRRKPQVIRLRPKKGNIYTPDNIDEMLEKAVDAVDEMYPGFEFRMVALPHYQWNIIPATEGESRMRTFEIEVGSIGGGRGHSLIITTAGDADLTKIDTTAVATEGVVVRLSSGYITAIREQGAVEATAPAADSNLVQGVSNSETPTPEPPAPDNLVKGTSTFSDDTSSSDSTGTTETLTVEQAADAGLPIRQVTEFSEQNKVEDLEADVNDSKVGDAASQ